MTASRLVLQSVIVLFACLVGFVLGRWGAVPLSGAGSGEVQADWPPQEPIWDFDAVGSLGGSLPTTTEMGVDSASGSAGESDRGPNRQFFPDTPGRGSGPNPFVAPESADPIRGSAPAATSTQIKALIEQELPDASESDKKVWAEELEGLSFESVREVLQLKQSLGPLKRFADSPDNFPADPERK